MRQRTLLAAIVISLASVAPLVSGAPATGAKHLAAEFGQLPLYFEPNIGQTDPEVRYLARAAGMTMFVTAKESVLVVGKERAVVRMKLDGARAAQSMRALEPASGISNYFLGNDPKKWSTRVPHYGRIEARQIYPGVDLVYYGNQSRLEYDFVVEPGADPSQIQLSWDGVNSIRLNAAGDLVLSTAAGNLVQHKPVVYQERNGQRVAIDASYRMRGSHVAFELAKYDRSRKLVIDPVLAYSTYLGGNGADQGLAIAVDSAGAAYITGEAPSTDFPLANPFQGLKQVGASDAFITKVNPSGNTLAYSTYIGGLGLDIGTSIAVDQFGAAYVAGYTASPNFPTLNPLQGRQLGNDAFVVKLNPSGGTLAYSTYLGGNDDDFAFGIAVDSSGAAYITGLTLSSNFPILNQVQVDQPGGDAFVTKLGPSGNVLAYSTYLGGNDSDYGQGIAVDSSGAAFVVGNTSSTNYPTVVPMQTDQPGADAFVTKLAPAGSIAYSTYLGGNDFDTATAVAVDAGGNAYVTGYTSSSNFPLLGPMQNRQAGIDAFVTKIAQTGTSLVYSTYLGGSGNDFGQGIAVDTTGAAWVTGVTASINFPQQNSYQADKRAGNDAFAVKLGPGGNVLIDSTYLGGDGDDGGSGVALDPQGNAYITGYTSSTNFPVQAPFQTDQVGMDAFLAKLTSSQILTTVTTTPAGLQLLVDSANCVAPCSFSWTPGSVHIISATSPQTLSGQVYTFQSWSNSGAQAQAVTASSASATYTATYSTTSQLTLTMQAGAGGLVSPGSGTYTKGQTVAITASPNAGYVFSGWTGSGSGSYTGPNGTVLITMNEPITEVATFTPSSCVATFSISPQQQAFPIQGGTGTVTVAAAAGCPWIATPIVPWLTVTAGATGSGNGTVSYTVAANGTGQRTGTLLIAGQTLTITQAGYSGTTNAFVQRMYIDFLGRTPDAGGLAFWANLIDTGAQSRGQVALSFFNSAEFRDTGLYITNAYTAVLGRDPDYAGWRFYFDSIRSGQPRINVVLTFIASPEFQNTYGSLNNQQFVQLVYQNVLGRQPDGNGLIYWLSLLQSGLSRAQMMESFFLSDEYRVRVRTRQLSNLCYLGFLGRTPDAAGRAFWTAQLDSGLSDLDLVNQFIGSQEFAARL